MVGSLIGLALMNVDAHQINYQTLRRILVSWVTSPGMGFAVSFLVFRLINSMVIKSKNPLYQALRIIPYFFGNIDHGARTRFAPPREPINKWQHLKSNPTYINTCG